MTLILQSVDPEEMMFAMEDPEIPAPTIRQYDIMYAFILQYLVFQQCYILFDKSDSVNLIR